MTAKQYLTNNIKLRIDDETLDALERLAAEGDRTVAAEMRRAIRKHIATEPSADPLEPAEATG